MTKTIHSAAGVGKKGFEPLPQTPRTGAGRRPAGGAPPGPPRNGAAPKAPHKNWGKTDREHQNAPQKTPWTAPEPPATVQGGGTAGGRPKAAPGDPPKGVNQGDRRGPPHPDVYLRPWARGTQT